MYLGGWKIDDVITFYANTTRFDTGAATDADSVPTYRVYEDETSTPILTGSMALLDSSNTAGFYSEQITLSAANGFEKGKSYAIYIQATVNSVIGATHRTLQIEPEVDANTVSGTVANVTTVTNLTNAPTNGDLTTAMKVSVNTEVDTALADIHLDHLIAVADPGGVVANSSFLAKLASKSATPAFSSYNNTTDSLEAIRDRGDAAWADTGAGGTFFDTEYTASLTTTASDPGAGNLRWNNATQANATNIYIDQLSNLGEDLSYVFSVVQAGDRFYIQDKNDASVRQEWLISSITNNTGWYTLAVAPISAVGGNLPAQVCLVRFKRTTDIAGAIWSAANRTLTAIDEDTTTLDLDATIRTAVGLASANLDTQLDALPTTAEVNSEVDTALADIHLDHLLAANYDPANKPGVATALLNELIGNDGGVSQFTANALELAPSGGGGSAGAGAIEHTLNIDDGSNPLDGVEVWVTTDAAGNNVVAYGVTDAFGEVTFMLDAGTYYAWKQLAGYSFTNPESITVS